MKEMTISQFADKAGVNIQTIRYYESIALLPKPKRTESGYRLFTEEDLENIHFIKNAQDLGLSLEEVKELVDLRRSSKALGQDVKKFLNSKIEKIDEQIKELKAKKNNLEKLNKTCSGEMPTSCCPILQKLKSSL